MQRHRLPYTSLIMERKRLERASKLKYGILHNNFFYFYKPVKADGTQMKNFYVKRLWIPLGQRDGKCIPFATPELAVAAAEDQFYNDKSWKLVDVEDDGTIIMTPEIEKLKIGYRPTRADEGEKAE